MYRSLQAAHSWVPSRVPGYVIVEGAAKQLPAEPTAGDKCHHVVACVRAYVCIMCAVSRIGMYKDP